MEHSNLLSHGLMTCHTFGLGEGGLGKLECCFYFLLFMTNLFSMTKMISVFQDKLVMELGYRMKYIFTEDQYGGLYEGLKDNPNEIPHDDLKLVIL